MAWWWWLRASACPASSFPMQRHRLILNFLLLILFYHLNLSTPALPPSLLPFHHSFTHSSVSSASCAQVSFRLSFQGYFCTWDPWAVGLNPGYFQDLDPGLIVSTRCTLYCDWAGFLQAKSHSTWTNCFFIWMNVTYCPALILFIFNCWKSNKRSLQQVTVQLFM